MSALFQQARSFFPPGIRGLLTVLLAVYLAALAGKLAGVFDLYSWLALSSPAFWNGSVWQIITYAFLPASFWDFITNAIILAVLAARLETIWTGRQLWSFCVITAGGAGLGKVLITPHSLTPLVGMAGVTFGLLVAWVRLFGSQEFTLRKFWPLSVHQMVLIIAVLGFLLALLQQPGGVWACLSPLCGGLVGWLYLSIRWHRNPAAQNLPVTSARIGKLEL